MKSDIDLQKDILDALKWVPLLNSAKIEVLVNDGFVTLSGIAEHYLDKLKIENITKSIDGVKAIIEHITVSQNNSIEITDEVIARCVLDSFKMNLIPFDRIIIKVENGHVTIDGEVTYNFQKEDAMKSVGSVKGIKIFTNNLILVPETQNQLEKKTIEHALLCYSATVDQNIRVEVLKNIITLKGTVQSIYQKEQAEKIAWNAPGALMVHNELMIKED